jgi:hypothetical protein
LASAEWSFNVQVGWVTYRNEVITSLQKAGYELLTDTGDSVAFARHVPGDSYRVSVERKESASEMVMCVSPRRLTEDPLRGLVAAAYSIRLTAPRHPSTTDALAAAPLVQTPTDVGRRAVWNRRNRLVLW